MCVNDKKWTPEQQQVQHVYVECASCHSGVQEKWQLRLLLFKMLQTQIDDLIKYSNQRKFNMTLIAFCKKKWVDVIACFTLPDTTGIRRNSSMKSLEGPELLKKAWHKL